jgi:RNA polymerase sigma factor (TIGR02999 family)
MSEATRLIDAMDQGDPHAAGQLLPLVYDELRRLAAQRLVHEQPGQTLQATALVHAAYIRLVDVKQPPHWDGRGHFFAAAAEAMRRILVENARRKGRIRHGGCAQRLDLDQLAVATDDRPNELLALHDALDRLEQVDAAAAQLVKLRFFAGLTMPQAADALAIPLRTAERNWTYARAWLHRALSQTS